MKRDSQFKKKLAAMFSFRHLDYVGPTAPKQMPRCTETFVYHLLSPSALELQKQFIKQFSDLLTNTYLLHVTGNAYKKHGRSINTQSCSCGTYLLNVFIVLTATTPSCTWSVSPAHNAAPTPYPRSQPGRSAVNNFNKCSVYTLDLWLSHIDRWWKNQYLPIPFTGAEASSLHDH